MTLNIYRHRVGSQNVLFSNKQKKLQWSHTINNFRPPPMCVLTSDGVKIIFKIRLKHRTACIIFTNISWCKKINLAITKSFNILWKEWTLGTRVHKCHGVRFDHIRIKHSMTSAWNTCNADRTKGSNTPTRLPTSWRQPLHCKRPSSLPNLPINSQLAQHNVGDVSRDGHVMRQLPNLHI